MLYVKKTIFEAVFFYINLPATQYYQRNIITIQSFLFGLLTIGVTCIHCVLTGGSVWVGCASWNGPIGCERSQHWCFVIRCSHHVDKTTVKAEVSSITLNRWTSLCIPQGKRLLFLRGFHFYNWEMCPIARFENPVKFKFSRELNFVEFLKI